MKIEKFTFNPFQENTFVAYDDSKECVIIDAGCYFPEEFDQLRKFIEENGLTPKILISTHSHLDHVFGNHVVTSNLEIPLGIHPEDEQTLNMLKKTADLYQIPNVFESPKPNFYFEHGDQVEFGNSVFDVRFVPGHAPGHVVFICHEDKFVVNGDCLFAGSIGRTDLPGGDHPTLINSIQEQLFTLPEDYTVYCGHGPETTIGVEKRTNPFF